jgi:hypothetical protein
MSIRKARGGRHIKTITTKLWQTSSLSDFSHSGLQRFSIPLKIKGLRLLILVSKKIHPNPKLSIEVTSIITFVLRIFCWWWFLPLPQAYLCWAVGPEGNLGNNLSVVFGSYKMVL